MRLRIFGVSVTLLGIIVFAAGASTARLAAQTQVKRVPVDCNRACLEGVIDEYLAALVAHDPKRLPLSADVKYTENDQVLDVGDGATTSITLRTQSRSRRDGWAPCGSAAGCC